MYRQLLKAFFLITLISCSPDKENNHIDFHSTEVVDVTELPFGRIDMLKQYEKYVFLNDFENSVILQYNKEEMKENNRYGRAGSGPGEFPGGVGTFEVYGDSLYAFVNQVQLHVFHINGSYERTINLPYGMPSTVRFTMSEDKIVFFNRSNEHPFAIIDMNGEILHEFGKWYGNFSDPHEQFANNISDVLYDHVNKQFVRVFKGYPFIEFYSESGEFLNRVDLKDEPVIEERFEFMLNEHRNDSQNLRITYNHFRDSTIFGNRLALLVYRHPDDRGAKYVWVLDLSKGAIDGVERYSFEHKSFETLRTIELIENRLLLGYNFEHSSVYSIRLK